MSNTSETLSMFYSVCAFPILTGLILTYCYTIIFYFIVWRTNSEPSWKPHTPTRATWRTLSSRTKDFKLCRRSSRGRLCSLTPSWLRALEDGWCLETTTTSIVRCDEPVLKYYKSRLSFSGEKCVHRGFSCLSRSTCTCCPGSCSHSHAWL